MSVKYIIDNLGEQTIFGSLSATSFSAVTFYGDGSNLTGVQINPFTGGSVSGETIFDGGISATTLSATTIDLCASNGTLYTDSISGCSPINMLSETIFSQGLSANTISGGTFFGDGSNLTGLILTGYTGNTLATCINDLYVSNVFGCSELTIDGKTVFTSGITGNSLTIFDGTSKLIDTDILVLRDSNNNESVFWGNRGLYDTEPAISVDWGDRKLYKSGGTEVIFDWNNGILSDVTASTISITGNTSTSTLSVTSSPFSGYVLTSDIVGNATWQPIPQLSFTGNSLSSCITDLFITNLHGCSPITVVDDLVLQSVSAGTNSDDILVRDSFGNLKKIPVLGLPFSNVTGLTFNLANYNLTIGSDNGSSYTQSLSILGSDLTVTGGTYNPNTGVVKLTNNTGGTFDISGFTTGYTDTFLTAGTFNNITDTLTLTLTNGTPITVTGITDYYTTGTTLIGSTAFFNRNDTLSAYSLNLSAFTGVFVTGATYSNNTFTFRNSTGGTFNVLFNTVTGLTVNGGLTVTGNTSVRSFTGTSGFISGSGQSILTVVGSGSSTTLPIFSVQGSNGELFSVTDSLTGSLFSVNDISGLPILEAFSNNTVLMGSYQAPSLNTTVKINLTGGTNTVYSIPTSAYTGAFFDYTLISTGSTGARAGNIMSIWSGSTAQFTETSTASIGVTTGVTFTVSVLGNNAILSSSATTSEWTLKTIVRSI